LLKSLESLYSKASDPGRIETLIKIDYEDTCGYSKIQKELEEITQGSYQLLVSSRKEGYWSLHHAWNSLARLATGEFLYLWNDDVIMETQDWDVVVQEYAGKICVIQGAHPLNVGDKTSFPLVHRSIPETCGFLSPTPFNDTYIHDFAVMLGIEVHDDRIQVTHNRSGSDETFLAGAATSIEQGPVFQGWWNRYNSEEVHAPMVWAAKHFRQRFTRTKTN
jgi:hypothetical protein